MNDPSHELADLLNRVIEGEQVDWAQVSRHFPDAENRARLMALIELDAIARGFTAESSGGTQRVAEGMRAWGPLQLRRLIRQDGSSELYEAWDPRVERVVDLRLIPIRDLGSEERTHLLTSIRNFAAQSSAHIAAVFGAELQEEHLGLCMEHIVGQTLREILAQNGPLSIDEACLLGASLCRALAAFHAGGLECGDLTPDSVIRERGGRVVVGCFRIQAPGRPSEALNPQSDLASLGYLLREAVAVPPVVTGPAETSHPLRVEASALQDKSADGFRDIIDRIIGHPPHARFESAGEAESALLELISRRPPPSDGTL